jgi:lambda family phage holin
MSIRLNDFGSILEQAIRESGGPALIGFLVAISHTIYKDGRKAWRVTFAEATMIAMATGTMGPILSYFGLPQDMAYPAAVFIGYVGIDRLSIAVCRRLGID